MAQRSSEKSWNELRDEVGNWSVVNFLDDQQVDPIIGGRALLGMYEEFGELVDAKGFEAEVDAAGDFAVYLCDFCSRRGIDLGQATAEAFDPENLKVASVWDIVSTLGRLSHAVLKAAQGIRGDQDHEGAIRECVGKLACLIASYSGNKVPGCFKRLVLIPTWEGVVSKRDWKKNPVNGQALGQGEEDTELALARMDADFGNIDDTA